MILKILSLLARFELAENDIRCHASAPNPSNFFNGADYEVALATWREGFQQTHGRLVKSRDEIELQVKAWMSVLATPSAPVDLEVLNELTYFTSWMSLRQDKRWGDATNAKYLATEIGWGVAEK